MTLAMLDSADSDALLPGYPAYGGYVDGAIGDQPNAAKIAAAHPGAHVLTIALSAEHDADCLDVEPGAASPSDVPGWIERQHARGVQRPCVYASVSTMRDEIIPLIAPGALVGWDPRLWTAHYGLGVHVCGPATCKQLPTDADGTQWTSTFSGVGGVAIDASVLADDFFGTPADPTQEIIMQLPQVKQGQTGAPVKTVQALCNVFGTLKIDGVFGPQTLNAVEQIQHAHGLTVDGIVGPLTWRVLLGVLGALAAVVLLPGGVLFPGGRCVRLVRGLRAPGVRGVGAPLRPAAGVEAEAPLASAGAAGRRVPGAVAGRGAPGGHGPAAPRALGLAGIKAGIKSATSS